RRHEGRVEVESEVGSGTSFCIKLPITETVANPRPVKELSRITVSPGPATALRILVVDDEEHVRELLHDILETEGCEVRLAPSAREALSIFEKENFDAIFTDVGMPDMSGWELSRAVRERQNTIPIAVITGWGEAVGSHERLAAQVDWVLPKPFDTPAIIEIAREVARRREWKTTSYDSCVAA
ncbi:MAG TPA: hybrid sensor histidine kinase/response regulator, partial [Pyrinomonadaceae bacterium]|nr:hybrid sensor histidine kinase/response regulator [Pyrinomonadaceae bacterium]